MANRFLVSALIGGAFVFASSISPRSDARETLTPAATASLVVERLETNGAATPLDIDDISPRFTWILTSERRKVMQTAFRVLVASRAELLREGLADIWDSHDVASANPWLVFAGPALKARTRYF